MKKDVFATLFSLILFITGGFVHVHAQICLWSRQSNGGAPFTESSCTTDNAGNTYVTGTYWGPEISFGSSTLYDSVPGASNIFLVKYDPSGNVLWAKNFGNDATGVYVTNFTRGIAIDPYGYLYLYGTFSGSIIFGADTLISNLYTASNFLVRVDSSGNVLWAKKEQQSVNVLGPFVGVVTDNAGGVIVAGNYDSTITIGGIYLTNPMSSGTGDVYIAKYDTAGNVAWAKTTVGARVSVIYNLMVDRWGDIYINGNYDAPSITFDTITITDLRGQDLFVAKYSSAGSILWAKTIGDSNCVFTDMGADAAGNIYLTGEFGDPTISFDTVTLTNASVYGGSNMFFVKYTRSGDFVWAKSARGNTGDSTLDGAQCVVVDTGGASIVGGWYNSSPVIFGNDTLFNPGFFLAKYDRDGNVMWVKGGDNLNTGSATAVCRDGNGYIYTTGFFDGSLEMDRCTVTDTTPGNPCIFVAKFSTYPEGIPMEAHASNISLYPNPATTQLTMRSDNESISEVVMSSLLGQVLYIHRYNAQQVELDVAQLPAGIYVVRINGTEVRKFVKE